MTETLITERQRNFIREVAIKAGELLMEYYKEDLSMYLKGDINPVTIADTESEKLIIGEIKKAFPHHSILAEETGGEKQESEWLWVIDPLDGTTNYAHHYPSFCVSIALLKKCKPIMGVIYHPLLNEFFYAERGNGAYLNDRPMKVSNVDKLDKAFLTTGFAYDVHETEDDNVDNFHAFLKRSMAIRRGGSAALDLAYTACGRFDGFWEMRLHPWDTAAGILMVEEAGGRVTTFDGGDFDIYKKEILATNGLIHNDMIDVLKGI
ncbi:MAG: inositol monophosphatase [Candidatus Coatesbacteria bacterium]|nr:MAG: inositol monophosphatase [Candidatus Coatesbacteria bacterium]